MNHSTRKGKPLSSLAKEIFTCTIKLNIVINIFGIHHGIRLNSAFSEAIFLDFPSFDDLLAKLGRGLIETFCKQGINLFSRNF